jgi:hypothetical protein
MLIIVCNIISRDHPIIYCIFEDEVGVCELNIHYVDCQVNIVIVIINGLMNIYQTIVLRGR